MLSSQLIVSQQPPSSFLRALKSELLAVQQLQLLFKQDTLSYLNQCMGKITTLFHKTAREKAVLEQQLQKSRQTQNTMRAEVFQLKQMINQAMVDYSKDLQNKEKEIQRLSQLLKQSQGSEGEIRIVQRKSPGEEGKSSPEEHQSSREEMLQVIQEESEQATYSSATSLRQFHSDQHGLQPQDSNQISSRTQELQEVSLPNCLEDNSNIAYRKTRNFINKGWSHVEEAQSKKQNSAPFQIKIHLKQPNQGQHYKKSSIAQYNAQPLKEIGNFPEHFKTHCSSLKSKDQQPAFTKTIILQNLTQESLGESSIDDLSKVSGIEQESQINPIKKFETPTSLFVKKKSNHQRFKTEPSPDSHYPCNYYTQKPHRESAKRCDRSFSDCKSIKTSTSKEKIKVTSRMVQEMGYQPKRNQNANNAKAVVYLGGKSLFRKFLLEIKQAFKKYQINQASEALYLDPEPRTREKNSRGTILLRNGMVYEGQLRGAIRHGRGSLSLNGISIYEGQWYQDSLHGQGYIKSLRLMSNSCPGVFQEASYCGNLQGNRFHGIGTIFLNPKEKIVTKFQAGCPVGELTYYNLHEIEFGVWPSD